MSARIKQYRVVDSVTKEELSSFIWSKPYAEKLCAKQVKKGKPAIVVTVLSGT